MSESASEEPAPAAEQRLINRFFDLWERLAGDRPLPALRNFTSDDLVPFKPFSVVIDLQQGYDQPIIRHVGSAIVAVMGQDFKGRRTEEVPRRSILSRITDHLYEVLANRSPVGFEAHYTDQSGQDIPYRGILAPLSDDGETINFILAAINWRGAPAWQQPSGPDLGEALAVLRERVAGAGRARNALYDVLADVYGFYRTGQQVQADYQRLLRDHGIRAQARAPFTAALKLAFGTDYDKTRLTEYAAAMNFAHRQGLDRDAFLAALHDTPGGLKALVRAERAVRGGRDGAAPGRMERTLAELTPCAIVDDWRTAPGDGNDYVVILARQSDPGANQLALLDALPARPGDLRRFVRKGNRP
ncbi:MAG: PAS domain-containing protein [Alphaproteobacteria bacterium]|nr:MAG: PAS domain-containing protein [Alphaproteobacteria bacterium]